MRGAPLAPGPPPPAARPRRGALPCRVRAVSDESLWGNYASRFIMDDEKLIECVRNYPELYDVSEPKYLDSKHKTSIWAAIGSELNETSNACKSRWTNIRDQFKRNLNKRKTKNGQTAAYAKKYKYEEVLDFLLPHIQSRTAAANVDYESVSEESRYDIESSETAENYDSPMISFTDNQLHDNSTSQSNLLESTTQIDRPQSRKRRQNSTSLSLAQPSASASQTLMEYIINKKEKQENVHPIDAFFKGLAPTIKQFSPYYQHLARGRIFQVVHELEWEQLSSEPNVYAASSPSQSTKTQSPPHRSPSEP